MILLFFPPQAGETALHVCARYDQPEVLSFLCQARAMLDIPDNVSELTKEMYTTIPITVPSPPPLLVTPPLSQDGDTPLLCGAWHGYQTVVECLVQAGSSLQCCNKDGETPLHVAAVRGYFTLVQYFCLNRADLNARDKVAERSSVAVLWVSQLTWIWLLVVELLSVHVYTQPH